MAKKTKKTSAVKGQPSAKTLLEGESLHLYLDQIRDAGMEVTRQWHTLWQEAIRYVWSEQYRYRKNKPEWEYIVANYIFPLIMQSIAKLTRNTHTILGRPYDDEEADYAEMWQGILQYVWEKVLSMQSACRDALLDANLFGYAVGRVRWNPRSEYLGNGQWEGEVEHLLIHPAWFWVDPTAEKIDKARNCGTYRPVRLDWAIEQWPEYAEEIRIEAKRTKELFDYAFGVSSERPIYGDGSPAYVGTRSGQTADTLGAKLYSLIVSLIFNKDIGDNQNPDTEVEYVWLEEIYFQDPYEKHVKIEDKIATDVLETQGVIQIAQDGSGLVLDAQTGQEFDASQWPTQVVQEYDEPLFPRGRVVLRIGHVQLNRDREEQKYEFSKWPFRVMPCHILPHMWQGANSIEVSRSSQDLLNTTLAHLIHHVQVNSNPIRIIEAGTLCKRSRGAKPQVITGAAGEMIVVNKGRAGGIQNLEALRMDPEAFALVQLLRKDIEQQQFMNETAQGLSTRDKSATEAARMDTNAHDMTHMRAALLDEWVEGTAQIVAEIVQKNYDVNRRVRIIGVDGVQRNMQMDSQLKRVEWDLEIEPGSTLPFDEEIRKQDYAAAYGYLQDPIPNPLLEDMLRILKIANRQKVLEKHRQTQLFRQFVILSSQIAQADQMGQEGNPEGQMAAQAGIMQQILMLMKEVQGLVPQQAG